MDDTPLTDSAELEQNIKRVLSDTLAGLINADGEIDLAEVTMVLRQAGFEGDITPRIYEFARNYIQQKIDAMSPEELEAAKKADAGVQEIAAGLAGISQPSDDEKVKPDKEISTEKKKSDRSKNLSS